MIPGFTHQRFLLYSIKLRSPFPNSLALHPIPKSDRPISPQKRSPSQNSAISISDRIKINIALILYQNEIELIVSQALSQSNISPTLS